MDETLSTLRAFVLDHLPALLIPVAVLVIGWLVALVSSFLVRGALRRTGLDERIATKVLGPDRAPFVNSAGWTGKVVYYGVLAFTVVAFLEAAALSSATEPIEAMLASVLEYLPRTIGAAVVLLVAWLIATLTRRLLSAGVQRFGIDERVAAATPETSDDAVAKAGPAPVGNAIAELGFWLVILLFMPAVLGALQLDGLLEPVQSMVHDALGFLPNLVGAGLILAIGWFLARLAQRLTSRALAAAGADGLSNRVGMGKVMGTRTLSSLVGILVYALILIPVAIATLRALRLESVTAPASAMLEVFLMALPALFGATLLLAVAFFAARLLSEVVTKLLQGMGFDNVLSRVGIAKRHLGERTPSGLLGGIVLIAALLFAAIEAARMLDFMAVAELGNEFARLGGRVLVALVVFGFGMFLAKLAATAVRGSGFANERLLSFVTRGAILVLAGAMSLRQLGIADEIIELAFGFTFGSVAVAAALAFGLGGREPASKTLERFRQRLQPDARGQEPPGPDRASSAAE